MIVLVSFVVGCKKVATDCVPLRQEEKTEERRGGEERKKKQIDSHTQKKQMADSQPYGSGRLLERKSVHRKNIVSTPSCPSLTFS